MIPSSVRSFVCTRPYDMRCSYDTLALAAQRRMSCLTARASRPAMAASSGRSLSFRAPRIPSG